MISLCAPHFRRTNRRPPYINTIDDRLEASDTYTLFYFWHLSRATVGSAAPVKYYSSLNIY